MFDLTPLLASHLILLLATFVAVFVVLRVTSQGAVRVTFGGGVLAACIAAAAFAVLPVQLAGGLGLAALLVWLVGSADERTALSPLRQFVWQIIIAVLVVSFGWTIPYVSNPAGEGVVMLDWRTLGPWIIPGSIVAVVWLVFLMNAVNWLDGVDGLAPSVAVVASATLAAVSLLPSTQDGTTLALAAVGLGGLLAFLLWNFPPARVYLGTTGSWFTGLYLGLVAMIGGGKIVTSLLVLALPAVDVLLVFWQRVLAGRAPWRGDTVTHLHFRLAAKGFSPKAIVITASCASAVLGAAAVLLSTYQKLAALIIAAGMLLFLVAVTSYSRKEYSPKSYMK